MKKEFIFNGAKRGARANNADAKVAVSVRLDAYVVAWLREQADEKAIPNQTMMNSILKQAMKG